MCNQFQDLIRIGPGKRTGYLGLQPFKSRSGCSPLVQNDIAPGQSDAWIHFPHSCSVANWEPKFKRKFHENICKGLDMMRAMMAVEM